MEVSIPTFSTRKKVLDFMVEYYKTCKASVGTNVLNEGNYVESAKEEQVKEDNTFSHLFCTFSFTFLV
jgi:hypothetical protein